MKSSFARSAFTRSTLNSCAVSLVVILTVTCFSGIVLHDVIFGHIWTKRMKINYHIFHSSQSTSGGVYLYKYRPIINGEVCENGTAFNLSSTYLRTLDFPPIIDMVQLTRNNVDQFVFVTAADKSHFEECMDAISRVQTYFPFYTIYYYDLNLNSSNMDTANMIRRLKNVVYRSFNFSRYPAHVRILTTYAFKPIIVHEMLQIQRGVFWIDSSIRFFSSNLTSLYRVVINTGGVVLMVPTIAHNFQVTHAGMYRYLPIESKRAIETSQHGATAVLVYRTKRMYENIVGWWLLCSLVPECIAASYVVQPCHFGPRDVYAGCHRFDQSALNILVTNYYEYKQDAYFVNAEPHIMLTMRDSFGKEKLTLL